MRLSQLTSHRFFALSIMVLVLAGSYSPALQKIEDVTLSIFAKWLPSADSTDQASKTTLIEIDEPSLEKIGPWPWPRQKLATLIEQLKQKKPAAIGLYLPLDQPQALADTTALEAAINKQNKVERNRLLPLIKTLDGDNALARAIKKAGNVVLLSSATTNAHNINILQEATIKSAEPELPDYLSPFYFFMAMPYSSVAQTTSPITTFTAAAASTGLMPGSGNSITSTPLAVMVNNQLTPTFPLRLVTQALNIPVDSLTAVKGQGIRAGSEFFATAANMDFYPRLASDNDQHIKLRRFSVTDIFEQKVSTNDIKDRIILIGHTSKTQTTTLQGPGNIVVMPVEWAAATVNALLSNHAITTPYWSLGLQRGLMIILGGFLLFLPGKLRSGYGIAASLLLAFLLINTSLVVMVTNSLWLPLTLPALFVVGGHVLLALRHYLDSAIQGIKNETTAAYLELANNHQSHGRLDQAYAYLCKCPLNETILEPLYNLGLDFERRRQFNKAASTYDTIARHDANYRDIQERRNRLLMLPQGLSKNTGSSNVAAATMVIDNADIARPIIGRYQIESEIGQGAMGTVYLGKDPKIGRTVAIKTLSLTEEFEANQLEEVRRRFFQEAETAGQLNHPNIVTIYDIGEEHDLAYIAMDYIEGKPLDDYTQPDTLLPIEDVFEIGAQIADALDFAHKHKVVHRDIKPANIIYNRESKTLKVTDFGIAYLADNSKTRTGTIMGSPYYMSPEQVAGQKADLRTDIFSLGVSLYELFTGHLPFEGDSMTSLMYQITSEKQLSIRKHRPELPGCLVRIINKALDKEMEKRFQSAEELANELRRCKPQLDIGDD